MHHTELRASLTGGSVLTLARLTIKRSAMMPSLRIRYTEIRRDVLGRENTVATVRPRNATGGKPVMTASTVPDTFTQPQRIARHAA